MAGLDGMDDVASGTGRCAHGGGRTRRTARPDFLMTRRLSTKSGQAKDNMLLNFQMSPPLVAVDRFTSYLARNRASDLNFFCYT